MSHYQVIECTSDLTQGPSKGACKESFKATLAKPTKGDYIVYISWPFGGVKVETNVMLLIKKRIVQSNKF